MIVLLTKIASNINLKTLTFLGKRLILVAWLDPGRVSAWIQLLKFKWRYVKIEDE